MVGQKGRSRGQKRGFMMSRATLIVILLLVVLIGGIVLLSNSADEVPVKPVEVDVSRDKSS
jgi:hypothetical protein